MFAPPDEEKPPDYDVTERVRQLNEELARDPTPISERERSIKFKEKLIDFEAPPPDYSESEYDDEFQDNKAAESSPASAETDDAGANQEEDNDAEVPQDDEPSSVEDPVVSDQKTEPEESASKEDSEIKKDEEKILVERNGKFELVSEEDLSAEEKLFYGITSSDQEARHSPHPPESPRPATANGTPPRHRAKGKERRAQSAIPSGSGFNADEYNYTSPYALTKEEKERLAKQKKRQEQNEKKTKSEHQKQEEQKKQEADEAFQAWLRKKREDAVHRRRQENEQRKQEEEEKRSNVSDQEDEVIIGKLSKGPVALICVLSSGFLYSGCGFHFF